MIRKHSIELIREGDFVAEVDVELTSDGGGWGPCLSVVDAQRLENVRNALRRGDLDAAAKHARVYALTPVAV